MKDEYNSGIRNCTLVLLGIVILLMLSNCKKKDDSLNSGNLIDIDGNVYDTVKIGTQVWMKENLRTTRLNDGQSIPVLTDSVAWITTTGPACCWYSNLPGLYKNTYGALYNYHVIMTGKLAPVGWHIPSMAEWIKLVSFLGQESDAGGMMKDSGTIYWQSPNTGATNDSRFTALPAGIRQDGEFMASGASTYWWSTDAMGTYQAYYLALDYNSAGIRWSICDLEPGFSVRCMKN